MLLFSVFSAIDLYVNRRVELCDATFSISKVIREMSGNMLVIYPFLFLTYVWIKDSSAENFSVVLRFTRANGSICVYLRTIKNDAVLKPVIVRKLKRCYIVEEF